MSRRIKQFRTAVQGNNLFKGIEHESSMVKNQSNYTQKYEIVDSFRSAISLARSIAILVGKSNSSPKPMIIWI